MSLVHVSSSLVLVGIIVAAISAVCFVADAAVITGVTPRIGSLLGGTRLTISGTGFDMRGRSNDVFIGEGTKGSFCDPVPNECTPSRIVCLTSVPGSGVQAVSVRSFGFLADCQISAGCTFEYSASYTPEVSSISPEWVTKTPTALTVTGSRFSQGDVTVAAFDFTLHLGEEERCELISSISSGSFTCNVHSMRPGALALDLIHGASGRAKFALGAKKNLLLIPTIAGVSPSAGSLRGGTIVTVTGTSFSNVLAENEIRIHGALCPVVSYAADFITCRTSPHAPTAAPAAPAWEYKKVLQEFWYNLPGINIGSDWHGKVEYLAPQESIYTSSVQAIARTCDNCAVRTTFFFYAPEAGKYNFSGSFDDSGEFWISADESPVEREQEERSLVTLDVTPFHSRRVLASSCCSAVNADPIDLSQGWHWARVYLKQAGGALRQDLSVTFPNGTAKAFNDIMHIIAHRPAYQPPVTARVRGIDAVFDTPCYKYGTCRFDYQAANTAIVSSVTPSAGIVGGTTTITIAGTGFDTTNSAPAQLPASCDNMTTCGGGGCGCKTSAECNLFSSLCAWSGSACSFKNAQQASCNTWSRNVVTLCGTPCYVTSQTSTELRCSVGYGIPAGQCLVEVMVGGQGRAISAAEISVAPSIEAIQPNTGYITGGNLVTIYGAGFDATSAVTDATSVTIGGAACAVTSVSSYRITCIAPAGTAGAQSVVVTVRGQIRSVAYDIVAFGGTFTRPGTSVDSAPITISPIEAGVRGTDRLLIAAPGRAFPNDAKITVTFGSSYTARVLSSSGESIVIGAPQLDVPRKLKASVVIKDPTGTTTLHEFTTPEVDFNSVVTSATNWLNPSTSNLVWIYGDFQPARQKDIKVAIGGQECKNVDFDPFYNFITCDAQPKLETRPALPTLEYYDFTPSGVTNVLSAMHYSDKVVQNSDATITIPADQYIMSKKRFTRPFAFEAKVRPTRTVATAGDNAQINMRFGFEDPTSSAGYHAAIGRNANGNFGLGVDSAWTSSTKEFTGAFAGIGLDPSATLTLRVEAYNQHILFYVNGVLASTLSDRRYLSGKLGFGFSKQQFAVSSITVSDLYPLTTQVNVSGVPMRANSDSLYGDVPVTVTSMPIRNFKAGEEVIAYVNTWVSNPRVYALRSETEKVSAHTPLLCGGSLQSTLTGGIKFTCSAGSLPAGSYYWLIVSTSHGSTNRNFAGSFAASLSGVQPLTAATYGTVITVSGAGFASGSRVKIGSIDCDTMWQNERRILCSVAAAIPAGNQAVTVTTSGVVAGSCGTSCTVVVSAPADADPTVSSVSPSFGTLPRAITINGANFNSGVSVWIANNECDIWTRAATKIVVYCSAAPSGAQPIKLRLNGVNGLFTTAFTVQAGGSEVAESSGSTQGGAAIAIKTNDLPAGTTNANLAAFNFANGVEAVGTWNKEAPATTMVCNGDAVLGMMSHYDLSRTFSNVAAHAAVKIAYKIHYKDWLRPYITIDDSSKYFIPYTRRYSGSCVRSDTAESFIAEGWVILPHTATGSLKVSFSNGGTGGYWGLASYSIDLVSTLAQRVTVGGANCPIVSTSPSKTVCRPVGANTAQTAAVSLTVGSTEYCPACQFEYSAEKTPNILHAVVSNPMGVAETDTKLPQFAVNANLVVTYSNGKAAISKIGGGNSWWNSWFFSPFALRETDAPVVGVSATLAGTYSMIGLTSTLVTDDSHNAIDFVLYYENGRLYAYRSGAYVNTLDVASAGDVVTVAYHRDCGCIKATLRGKGVSAAREIFSWESAPTFPLYIAGGLYLDGSAPSGFSSVELLAARAQTQRVVLYGEKFQDFPAFSIPDTTAVSLGGSTCVDVFVSNNIASCWVSPAAAAVATYTGVRIKSVEGYSEAKDIARTVYAVSPPNYAKGSTAGGHELSFTGSGFTSATTVNIDGLACTITKYDSNFISCRTPVHAAGTNLAVVVETSGNNHTCIGFLDIARAFSSSPAPTCVYAFDAASTPAITGAPASVQSSQKITITGTSFLTTQKPMVFLTGGNNKYACSIDSYTDAEIKCTLPVVAAGTYTLTVGFASIGIASGSPTNIDAALSITATSPSSTTGNLGNSSIVLTGSGFGTTFDGSSAVAVKIAGTNICAQIIREDSTLTCITLAGDHNSNIDVTINGKSASNGATFQTTSTASPTVTSVAPTQGGLGTFVAITGTGLADITRAYVGNALCQVQTTSATLATCLIVEPVDVGSQPVKVVSASRGLSAAAAAAAFSGSASISVSSSYLRVSLSKKNSVDIQGNNLGNNSEIVSVVGSRRCEVAVAKTASSNGKFTCEYNASADAPSDSDVRVRIFSGPNHASSASTYTFTSAVPSTITSVTPSIGSAAGMEYIRVNGTGFSTVIQDMEVRIGTAPCYVTETTSSESFVCITSEMPIQDNLLVSVVIQGQGRAAGSQTFNSRLNIDSVSSTDVSVEGGLVLTITGTGFWEIPDSSSWKYSRAILKVGSRICPIVSSTVTQLKCTLPPTEILPRVKNPSLVASYVLPPEEVGHRITYVLNYIDAVVNNAIAINYRHSATPRVSSVTVGGSSSVTIVGTNFAGNNNAVDYAGSACAITSESSTQVVCTLATGFYTEGAPVRVNVPGLGFTAGTVSCPGGQYLTCDGTCLSNTNCVYADWGVTTCVDLAKLIFSDTFCHSNGGTDRVALPFRSDDGTMINFNCPMYSCEGGDCDVYLTIGGMGARFSTCGRNPSGPVVKIAPTISSLSHTQSSTRGGLLLTITGTNFPANATRITIAIGGSGCTVTSAASTTSIVCRTGAVASDISNAKVYLYVDRVLASGNLPTINYVSGSWAPVITSVTPQSFVAGQVVTVAGTGFTTSAQLLFGSRYCTGVTADASQIVCTVPDQGTPGSMGVKADVPGKGYSNTITGTMKLFVSSISPTVGSEMGGTLVTLVGSAFNEDTRFSFGTCGSDFVSFSAATSSIVVRTHACAASAQNPIGTSGPSITGTTCGTACRFTFSTASTPVISAVSVGAGSLTISTSNMGANPQLADVSVKFAGITCTVTAFTATSTTCTFSGATAGTYKIMYLLSPLGYASGSGATFTSYHSIASIFPSAGSLGGGQRLTITGTGFSATAAHMMITVGASGAACTAVSSSYTEVVCLTGASASAYAETLRVAISDPAAITAPTVAASAASYTYDSNISPTVSSITPSRGSTAGGTVLTITGTKLSTSINVTVAGVECKQSAAQQSATTATSYTCTTGAYKTMFDPVVVRVATVGDGNAVNSQTYQYVDLWSRFTTWGNTPPPIRGDSVVIGEGTTVMVDYSPPRFLLVIVMGHLLFDWEADINFECTYIMINYGRFTVGTPEKPYLKKATITLYGDRLTPEIPVHGSKVIALRHGALDMHGQKRQPTWTHLAATAPVAAAKISVRGPVDWKTGEFIFIASTDFHHEHTEHRMITGVEPADGQADAVTLILEYPLAYEHYGQRQCFGSDPLKPLCVDEIAEVGLLTRNIVVQGDRNSMNIGFGGTMFLMPMGESSDRYARLSYVELRQVGQQFIVGRYPVHYHVTHESNNSYVNGTSVHQSLNRAFSIHGISNNTYVNNVAYDIHGHAFFIEDGSEKWNVIDRNFVAHVLTSTSNLNTDLTPANYWIVSASNKVTNNAAGGGDAYGFWISPFHPHSTGPTFSTSICPHTHKLWEFNNNVAHSNHKYGFNIFKYWFPKKVECDLSSDDEQAVLHDLVAYKNQIWGLTHGNHDQGEVGALIFERVISADNGLVHPDAAAFWIEVVRARNMSNGVRDSVMIAKTNNQPNTRTSDNRRGINLAKGDNFFVHNVTFVNYVDSRDHGFEPQAWADRLSLCFPYGWEAVTSQISWVNSPNRVLYRFDHHGIINDLDGTVGGSANSQILTKSPIMDSTICRDATIATQTSSLVCPDSYKVRRFGVSSESEIWQPQIWNIDGRQEVLPVISRKYIMTAPVNRKVNISFQGVKVPDVWDWKFGGPTFTQPGEKVLFEVQHNETRHHVYASFDGALSKAYNGPQATLAGNSSRFSFNNETSKFHGLLVYPTKSMSVASFNCPEAGCAMPTLPPGSWDTPCKPYHLPASWVSGVVPTTDGATDLSVNNDESLCLGTGFAGAATCNADSVMTYEFRLLRLEGSFHFRNEHCPCDGATVHVKVGAMWIRQGGLLVGNATHKLTRCNFRLSVVEPDWFNPEAVRPVTVRPWGARSVVLESGMLMLNGEVPAPHVARLVSTAGVGATTIAVDRDINSWKVGDWVYIAGTNRREMYTKIHQGEDAVALGINQRERRQITAISADKRTISLNAPLAFSHFGTAGATIDGKTYQVGAEVVLVNRKIVIDGGRGSLNEMAPFPAVRGGWQLAAGCTPDNFEGCAVWADGGWPMSPEKPGYLRIEGAWLRDCGQGGILSGAGVHIDGLMSQTDASLSFFRFNTVERALHTAIMIRHTTTNLRIEHNTIVDPEGDGIAIIGEGNSIVGNIIIGSGVPYSCDVVYHIFPECRASGIRARGRNTVTDNIVAGHLLIGILTDGDVCENALTFANNYLHSNRDGMVIYDQLFNANMNYPTTGVPTTCRKVGGAVTYWNGDQGVVFWYATGSVILENVVAVENTIGVAALLSAPTSLPTAASATATYRNLVIAGFFDGMSCRSAEHHWKCINSLVDSQFWCDRYFHGLGNNRKVGSAGLLETVFVSAELDIGRTQGEKKFRWIESDSYATMIGQAIHDGITFANFDGNDACGLRNIAFHNNIFSNDTFKHHIFKNVKWAGTIQNGGEYWATRMYGQANIITSEREPTWFVDYDNAKFGGYWPDAPNKNLIVDADGTFTKRGAKSSIVADESLIRPTTFDRIGYSGRAFSSGSLDPAVAGCTWKPEWNAHLCNENYEWQSITIDSLADDRLTRRPGPVVMCKGDGDIDTNGWPLCQGGGVQFASGPVMKGKIQRATLDRLSRYKFHVTDRQNLTLAFRGAPPAWMRLIMHDHEHSAAGASSGVTINLRFHGLNSQLRQAVYVDGVRQKPNVGYGFPWTYGQTWPGPRDNVGTHFHNKLIKDLSADGLNRKQYNTLYFTMRPGAVVEIKAEEIVQLTMDVAIPLDSFFGQKDTFVVALATQLGIDSSRLKFANIVPGSNLAAPAANNRRSAYALASSGNTSVSIDIAKREGDAQTSYNSGTNVNDFAAIQNAVKSLSSTVGGLAVANAQATVSEVQYSYTPVRVQDSTPYISCNATKLAGSAYTNINQTEMKQLLMQYYKKTYPLSVPYNTTTLDEAGVSNVYHNQETGWSRVVISLGYEDNYAIRDGLQYILPLVLESNTTAQRIFPNHLVRNCDFNLNGWTDGASRSVQDSNSALVFGVATGVSLFFVIVVGLGVTYYYFVVRPRNAVKQVEKELDEYEDEKEPAVPTSSSRAPDDHPVDQYDQLGRPYFYDKEGQPYYYDENGRAHYYYDTHSSEAPMYDELGRQYYYDDQGQPYFLDQDGNPKYYYAETK